MPNRGDRVYVDTNAILESHRIKCWNGIASRFSLCSVEKCVEECATGNLSGAEIEIDITGLRSKVVVEEVNVQERVQLNIRLGGRVILDAGEEHLIAKAVLQKNAWMLCSPDKAAIRAVGLLNLGDRLVSLEELAQSCGQAIGGKTKGHYLKKWLENQKTILALEILG
jgi:hypothetical protein